MSLFHTPSDAIMLFKLTCFVVPKNMHDSMLELVHKFHFNETAKIAATNEHFWWP